MGYKKLTDDEIVEALAEATMENMIGLGGCDLSKDSPFLNNTFLMGLFFGSKWMQDRICTAQLVEQACEDFKKRSDALREAIFDWGDLEAQYNTMHYMKFIVSFEETLNHISASLARLGMKGRLTYHNVFGDITFRI